MNLGWLSPFKDTLDGRSVVKRWALPFVFLLLPGLIAVVAIVLLVRRLLGLKETEDRTPEEVAAYLRNFIEDKGESGDWDDFESVPITDPTLDEIRCEAAMAGPPHADVAKLSALLQKVEAMAFPIRSDS